MCHQLHQTLRWTGGGCCLRCIPDYESSRCEVEARRLYVLAAEGSASNSYDSCGRHCVGTQQVPLGVSPACEHGLPATRARWLPCLLNVQLKHQAQRRRDRSFATRRTISMPCALFSQPAIRTNNYSRRVEQVWCVEQNWIERTERDMVPSPVSECESMEPTMAEAPRDKLTYVCALLG